MPGPNDLRDKQREEIKPLITELKRRFAGRKRITIANESGITNYQVGRILGEALPAPTYLDITKLLRVANVSPNEAAELVGLYTADENHRRQQEEKARSLYERRLLTLLRNSRLTQNQQRILAETMETFVEGLERQALLDDERGQQSLSTGSP